MMLLDNGVFGNRRFKLLDSTIFKDSVGYIKLNNETAGRYYFKPEFPAEHLL